jgi:hypothetical protein
MAAPTLAANATEAQALAYLNAEYGSYKYTNTAKTAYQGKTAAQIYAYLKAQNPAAAPYSLAVASADLIVSSEVGQGVAAGVSTGTSALGDTATGVATANYGFALSSLLAALTSKNLWVRVGKVVIGGALVIIGLAHMTGASGAVATIARKAPLPV